MRNKTYILLTVGITLLVLTPAAKAQDEQWLQYYSEREAHRIVRDMGRSLLLLLSNKPQGVEVSQLKTSNGHNSRKILILSWNWNVWLRSQAYDMGNFSRTDIESQGTLASQR